MKHSTVIGIGTLLLISSLVLTGCCCPWFAPTPTPRPTSTPGAQVFKAQSDDGEVVISGTAAGIEDIKSVDPIPEGETKQLVQQHCPGTPLSNVLKGVEIEPSGLTLSPAATILFYIGIGHGYQAYDPLTILTIPGCEKAPAEVTANTQWAEGKIYHSSVFVLVRERTEEPSTKKTIEVTVEVIKEVPVEVTKIVEEELLRESIVGIEVLDDYTLMIKLVEADDRIPELIQRWADSQGFGLEWYEVSDDGLGLTLALRKGEGLSYDFEKALRAALE